MGRVILAPLLTIAMLGCGILIPAADDPVARAKADVRDLCGTQDAATASLHLEKVRPFYRTMPSKSGHDSRVAGAILYVTPEPGTTAVLLERKLRCRAARDVTAGTQAPDDPFSLPGGLPKISVEADDARLAITVSDDARGPELLDRARRYSRKLAETRPSVW